MGNARIARDSIELVAVAKRRSLHQEGTLRSCEARTAPSFPDNFDLLSPTHPGPLSQGGGVPQLWQRWSFFRAIASA
jgi:hypothetical protein